MSTATAPGPVRVPSWESVLAGIEADVARTEDLVREAARPNLRGPAVAAAEVMFPGSAPNLPDPADLPEIPFVLLGRMESLRERIAAAQHALTDALSELARHAGQGTGSTRPLLPVTAPAAARYVDRTA